MRHERRPPEGGMMALDATTEVTMTEPAVRASRHRTRWGWWLVGVAGFVIVAAVIGYQFVQPVSDWVNDVLGSLSIGE